MLTSTNCPYPLFLLSPKAATMPITANKPAMISPKEAPGLMGGPPGSPVRLIMPPIAWMVISKAGLAALGPVCPKPEIAA